MTMVINFYEARNKSSIPAWADILDPAKIIFRGAIVGEEVNFLKLFGDYIRKKESKRSYRNIPEVGLKRYVIGPWLTEWDYPLPFSRSKAYLLGLYGIGPGGEEYGIPLTPEDMTFLYYSLIYKDYYYNAMERFLAKYKPKKPPNYFHINYVAMLPHEKADYFRHLAAERQKHRMLNWYDLTPKDKIKKFYRYFDYKATQTNISNVDMQEAFKKFVGLKMKISKTTEELTKATKERNHYYNVSKKLKKDITVIVRFYEKQLAVFKQKAFAEKKDDQKKDDGMSGKTGSFEATASSETKAETESLDKETEETMKKNEEKIKKKNEEKIKKEKIKVPIVELDEVKLEMDKITLDIHDLKLRSHENVEKINNVKKSVKRVKILSRTMQDQLTAISNHIEQAKKEDLKAQMKASYDNLREELFESVNGKMDPKIEKVDNALIEIEKKFRDMIRLEAKVDEITSQAGDLIYKPIDTIRDAVERELGLRYQKDRDARVKLAEHHKKEYEVLKDEMKKEFDKITKTLTENENYKLNFEQYQKRIKELKEEEEDMIKKMRNRFDVLDELHKIKDNLVASTDALKEEFENEVKAAKIEIYDTKKQMETSAKLQLDDYKNTLTQRINMFARPKEIKELRKAASVGVGIRKNKYEDLRKKPVERKQFPIDFKEEWHDLNYLDPYKSMPYTDKMDYEQWEFQKRVNLRCYYQNFSLNYQQSRSS